MKNRAELEKCDFCQYTVNLFHIHVVMEGKEYTLCPEHFEMYKSKIFNHDESEDENNELPSL